MGKVIEGKARAIENPVSFVHREESIFMVLLYIVLREMVVWQIWGIPFGMRLQSI